MLFAASFSGGMLHLQVGQLSGITVGSTFALYPDQAAALAHSGLLGSGSVASVSPVSAVLTVTGAPRLPASAAFSSLFSSNFGNVKLVAT